MENEEKIKEFEECKMTSSCNNKVDCSDILKTITFMQNPNEIIEFGIHDGQSLKIFTENSHSNCGIKAFDDLNGNCANKDKLDKTFSISEIRGISAHNQVEDDDCKNVFIQHGDFYKEYKNIKKNSIDIIHIDIANDGAVLEFAFENYINKLTKNGIFIFEGGSKERDEVEWMNKYNKQKINPIFEKYKKNYSITTIGDVPSLTIVKKKN